MVISLSGKCRRDPGAKATGGASEPLELPMDLKKWPKYCIIVCSSHSPSQNVNIYPNEAIITSVMGHCYNYATASLRNTL